MKKLLSVLLALVMIGTVFAGGGGDKNMVSSHLNVWSFTEEFDQMLHGRRGLSTFYTNEFAKNTIDYRHINTDQFYSELDSVLESGIGAPDVFTFDVSFVRKYIESGQLLDLTDIYNKNKNKLLAYPVEIGTYEGRVYALSWHACPGAMFYRRSLAKKYLGTDDPVIVQQYFSNFDKFMETAKLLNEKSNGSCVAVSSIGDLQNPFLYARKQPWVVDGKLVIDPVMEEYMDIAKTMTHNGYEGRIGQWWENWFAGMRDEFRDHRGNQVEVFSYFFPIWGLYYVLKENAPNTSGDWAMIQGPMPYNWGGTWFAAWKDTPNPQAAKQMIEWLTTNDKFSEAWAKATEGRDLVSNTNVLKKTAFPEPFLGGQNQYAEFAKMAEAVNGKLVQSNDEIINGLFMEALAAFVNGENKFQALQDFRAKVYAQLGIR